MPKAAAKANEAITHLRMICEGTHLIGLYRKFFPKQFKKERIDYSSADTVFAACGRFAGLVDQQLFPLWELEWMDDPVYALGTIPLYCTSNPWYDRMEEELSILEKTIVSGAGLGAFPDVQFRMPKTHELDHFKLLPDLCKGLKGPIRQLPAIVDFVLCGTLNPFIDCGQEEFFQGEMPSWSEQEIRFLTKAWKEAKELKRQYVKFEVWALARPERMSRIERLLKAAWVRKQEPKIRVQVGAGRPLVEIPEFVEVLDGEDEF